MADIAVAKPQYAQVADVIRTRILDGTYPRGGLLPSEERLAEELKLSRVTVNRALTLLRASGEVKVRRGTGTVVATLPRITRDATARYAARAEGTGAGEVEVRNLGLRSRTSYGAIGKVQAPPEVAAALHLDKREAALVRPRVLYADDEPTQIATSYLPWSVVRESKQMLQENAGEGGSYGRLAEIGHGPVRFTEDITIRMPTPEEQAILELEANQPVYQIWHVAYTADDRAIEVAVHVMPGHLWQLRYSWDDQPPKATR